MVVILLTRIRRSLTIKEMVDDFTAKRGARVLDAGRCIPVRPQQEPLRSLSLNNAAETVELRHLLRLGDQRSRRERTWPRDWGPRSPLQWRFGGPMSRVRRIE